MKFVDEATIQVKAGKGGNGLASLAVAGIYLHNLRSAAMESPGKGFGNISTADYCHFLLFHLTKIQRSHGKTREICQK